MKLNVDRQCSSKTPDVLEAKKCAPFADLERVRCDMGSPPPSPGPLSAVPKKRWFETGSLDTVNLGSSMKIFDEKYHERDPRRSHPGSRRGSCVKIVEEGEKAAEEKPLTNGKSRSSKKAYNRAISSDSYYANLPIRKSFRKRCRRQLLRVAKFFDLDLLQDPIYVNMMLGMSIAIFAELNFSLFTPFILADMN
uniref:Uncharacterized protein n=1 Tax=Lutzomyia longipalpis TaxID=7200 RepID=A0A1B0CP54_LUTLO